MEFDQEDQKIIELLTKLKNGDGNYPKKLLASRRHIYLNQIASIGAGVGIGAGLKTATKTSKTGAVSHLPAISASSLIESVLIVAIVIQASIVAYNYRNNIAEFFRSLSSVPIDVSIPVTEPSLSGVMTITPTVTGIPTGTPSITATPEPTDTTGVDKDNSTVQDATVTETPKPKDNNGNHFGQTPKPPKPTKEKNDPKPTKVKDNGNG